MVPNSKIIRVKNSVQENFMGVKKITQCSKIELIYPQEWADGAWCNIKVSIGIDNEHPNQKFGEEKKWNFPSRFRNIPN